MKLIINIIALFLAAPALANTAYDRVQQTNTLRCGYVTWASVFEKDPNTGSMSGYAYDYFMAIAKELNVKVEWAEEVGWGNYAEGLNTGRYDMLCVGLWLTGERAKASLFTAPIFYQATYAYSRADDTRLATIADINQPAIRLVTVDGDVTEQIHAWYFPQAQKASLTASTDSGQYLLQVTTNKADVALAEPMQIAAHNAHTNVKLKMIGSQPVRLNPVAYALPQSELKLKALVDTAIAVVNSNGSGAAILKKYEGLVPVTGGPQ